MFENNIFITILFKVFNLLKNIKKFFKDVIIKIPKLFPAKYNKISYVYRCYGQMFKRKGTTVICKEVNIFG